MNKLKKFFDKALTALIMAGFVVYILGCIFFIWLVRASCTHGNCVHGWYSKYNETEQFMAIGWIVGIPIGTRVIEYHLGKRRRKRMIAQLPDGNILLLIDEAITKNQYVIFSYQKTNGELSIRTVKPKRFKRYGQSLCIVGWCKLRNAERAFAIARISNIKIVDSL